MTKDGVTKLVMTMLAAYPNYHPADISATVRVWMAQLDGYRDEEAALALQAFILSDNKGFAPSIGQVVALIPRNQGDGMGEMEAWGLVSRAIRNGLYGAEEEFAKLPDDVRAAVGSAGQLRQWAAIETGDAETVAQSNFLRSYRTVRAREAMARKLPPQLRALYHRDPPQALPLDAKAEGREAPSPWDGVAMPEEYREKLGLNGG